MVQCCVPNEILHRNKRQECPRDLEHVVSGICGFPIAQQKWLHHDQGALDHGLGPKGELRQSGAASATFHQRSWLWTACRHASLPRNFLGNISETSEKHGWLGCSHKIQHVYIVVHHSWIFLRYLKIFWWHFCSVFSNARLDNEREYLTKFSHAASNPRSFVFLISRPAATVERHPVSSFWTDSWILQLLTGAKRREI